MANRKYALIGAAGSTAETDPVFLASAAYAITGTQITNWDTAFGWGDHSLGGYAELTGATFTGTVNVTSLSGFNAYNGALRIGMYHDGTDGNVNAQDGVLRLKVASSSKLALSATSADFLVPVTASNLNVSNWDTAFGWGDHAGLYSLLAHTHAGVYEPVLGNPTTDGYVLSSTIAGVRSWVPVAAGGNQDIYASLSWPTYSYLDFDEYTLGSYATVLASIGSMVFALDTNNNGTSDFFRWYRDDANLASATQLMELDNSGNLSVLGAVTGSNLNVSNWDTAFSWGDHAGLYEPIDASIIRGTVSNPYNLTITGLMRANSGYKYGATTFLTSAGVLSNVTNTNWDAAYTYSQVGHLPLTGGTLTGDLTITGNITAANLGSSELKYKTADETISTSSSTLQNDNHLAGFALDAGAFYKVEGYLQASMTALTVDFKAQMSFTNTPQNGWMTLNSRGDTGSSVGDNAQYSSTCVLNITAGLSQGIIISGYIYANATTGGTMTLQWAKNALSLGESLTVFAGSWMKLTKLS